MLIRAKQAFYTLEKANKYAAALTAADEDGWTYKVIDCKNGLGRIDVYDEDGELVFKGMSVN